MNFYNKNIILFALLLKAGMGFAQYDLVDKAQKAVQAGKIDSAYIYISKTVDHPETSKDAFVWYVKGFILKEISKQNDAGTGMGQYRTDAIKCLTKALELDVTQEHTINIKKVIAALASSFQKESVRLMDTSNFMLAIKNYDQFKSAKKIADPNFNFKEFDLQFYNGLASVYRDIFEANQIVNSKCFDLAIENYGKAIELDANDYSPYYNIGSLYYNKGVTVINQTDYSTDLAEIEKVQDIAANYFKKGLPYFEKAYMLNSKKIKVIEALEGIYYTLNDQEKSEKFKAEKKKIEGN
ncbi:MAG: tetratricopeptide repeat protein [Bacteroidetes bacterium]|nr:tetratricopeptide repeat protein [Bacteroidota bacterium]